MHGAQDDTDEERTSDASVPAIRGSDDDSGCDHLENADYESSSRVAGGAAQKPNCPPHSNCELEANESASPAGSNVE